MNLLVIQNLKDHYRVHAHGTKITKVYITKETIGEL